MLGISPIGSAASDLAFLVIRMTPATRAKLFNRKLVGLLLFVLGRRIVPTLTAVALKSYKVSHLLFLCLNFAKPTMGIEPMTSSLPRKCSTD